MSKKNNNNIQIADAVVQIKPKPRDPSYYQSVFDMIKYESVIPNSVIVSYGIGKDFVRIQVKGNRVYKYTNESAGKKNIEKMKELAEQGKLDEFIDDEKLANLYEFREA